ncbi:MAG TPA: hypothetical protein VLD86_04800, partial [Ilumatobacteraceae bacterium]|nr:hypothetical protein [Ilumatobacteraceae bacterium]
DEDFSIGFDPSLHSSPGSFTTGVITDGGTFTAADTPFGGGTLPSDLPFTVTLPLVLSVTTATAGVLNTTPEVQHLDIDAKAGTFTLSKGGTTTAPLPFNIAATTLQTTIEALPGVGTGNVTVTRTQAGPNDFDLDGDGLDEFSYVITFDDSLGDVDALVAAGTGPTISSPLLAHTFSGQVRLAKAQAVGLAPALDSAIDALLSDTNIQVTVGTDTGKLTIHPVGSDLEVAFKSPITATAGGGRIGLDAPLAKVTLSQLAPAVELQRRLEIAVEFDDPAFQEMLIASTPTPLTGVIEDDIDFTLKVNGTDVPVHLAASTTTTNADLGQLKSQLQGALDSALGLAGFNAGDVLVKRAQLDENDPNSPEGNRFFFEGTDAVDAMSIFVPDTANNGAITELGFAAGQSDTKRSKAGTFFLDDVSFGGNFGLFANDVTATASLSLLAVQATGIGTLDVVNAGLAQAGTTSTITLAAGASSVNNFYNNNYVRITGGTGEVNETHKILDYNGATRVATIQGTWTTTPDNTTGYQVVIGDKFLEADVDFQLVNPNDGSSKVFINDIIDAISDGRFLFQAGAGGPSGFIDGVVSGGIGLQLSLAPAGAIAGLPVTLGAISISAESPNWLVAAPSLSNPFGFLKDDHSLAGAGVTVTTSGLISGNKLTQDMQFVLSETIGGQLFETPIVVHADDTVGNLTLADLEQDIQEAINKGILRVNHLAALFPVVGVADSIDVTVSSGTGNITFKSLNDHNSTAETARGLFVDLDFQPPSGFEDLLNSLKNLSFDDILAVLRLIIQMLQTLDGSSSGTPLASVFGFKIPVIDRSVSDLVHLSGDFIDFVDDLAANPAGSLQTLETKLRSLLGLPPIDVSHPAILSLDTTEKILFFDLDFASSTQTTRPFDLDLESLGLGIFSQLVGLSASGTLGVQAGIDLDLKMGLDLSGADKGFFIDVAGTHLTATASAVGNNLEFEASLGPVGVFVQGGSASLEGEFDVNLVNADSDGRLVLAGFDGSGVSSDLGHLLSFLDVHMSGTIEVILPLFYGLKSSPAPMGDAGVNQVFSPPTHFTGADSDHPFLKGNQLGLFVDLFEIFDGSGDGDDGFEIHMPDFNLGDLSLPSLFTLLSDPTILVKGLNSVLKELQGILEGQLFGFELPLIGKALRDNPVATFIEDFRLDFLQPLADKIAESNLNLDGLIGLVEGVINDVFSGLPFFGGLHHQFLDANGDPIDVLHAKSLQFDFDLGDTIGPLTLADADLDLGIPLLSLEGHIAPRLTMTWHLHFGFGVDLDKGFYFVSDFDKEASAPDGTPGKGVSDPEMTFNLSLDLGSSGADPNNPADDHPAVIAATLAILQLQLQDGVDIDKSGVIESDEYTGLFIDASLDLVDEKGAQGGGSDGKLTIPELLTQSPLDTFVFSIAGGATLFAHGELSLGGLDKSSGLSLGSVLPSISADFIVNFDIGYNTQTGLDVHPPEVVLANISLDLGDFIGGFAGDVLRTIGDILDPLAWLIGPDGLLNLRLPLISDLLGHTVRIRDLINVFDPDDGPKVNAFLDFVEELYFLTDLVGDAASGATVLNFGDLVLFQNVAGSSFFDDFPTFIDKKFALGGLGNFGGDLRKVPNLNDISLPNPGDADFSAQPSTTQSFTSGITKPGSIEFPILKPETIFG